MFKFLGIFSSYASGELFSEKLEKVQRKQWVLGQNLERLKNRKKKSRKPKT